MGRVVVIAERSRAEAVRSVLAASEIDADVFVPESDSPDHAVAEYRETMQRLAVAGTLAAGVAHDVANIVTVLMAQLGQPDPAARIDEIRTGLNRLQAVARGLTSFARPSHGFSAIDLSEVADEATHLVEASLGRAIVVERDLCGGATIMASRAQVLQVAINLLLNAGQALAAQKDGWILVSTSGGAEHVSMTVADNGPGMSDDQQAAAFDPFFTTRTTGSGLGLYICQHVVLGHRGQISIDSRPSRGTRVTVRLPREQPK